MTRISIKDIHLFEIKDEREPGILYGCDQDWYGKHWQRMAGCGPCTVTNIMYYVYKAHRHSKLGQTRSDYLKLMNEIWNYVTPGMGGVSSTSMLMNGFGRYLQEQKLKYTLDNIDIERKVQQRPELSELIAFLENALMNDIPAAFLNLEHGTIHELESWHWVTVLALEYDLEEKAALITIMDNGDIKRIDLARWLSSTKLGGGFVSLTLG